MSERNWLDDFNPAIGNYWGFQGRNVVFVGGNSDLALPLAQACAKMGANIAILSRTAAKLETTKEAISPHVGNGKLIAHTCDVTSSQSLQIARDFVGDEFESADTVFFFAGHINPDANATGGRHPEDVDADALPGQFGPDYFGAIRTMSILCPLIAKSDGEFGPSVVFTDSIALSLIHI